MRTPDLDARVEPTQRPLDEQVAGGERVEPLRRGAASAQAGRGARADAQGAGYSYQEIGEHFGWTYTKVNRSITEGRRRFMQVFRAIESGEACEAYLPTIAALAGGSASSAEIIEIRPHLRHCSACRATVRQLHVPAGTTIKLLLPGFLLAGVQGLPDGVKRPEDLVERGRDLELVPPPDAPAGADAPAAHAIDLAGHLQLPLDLPERSRGVRLKDELLAVFHRTSGSDAATGVYIATSSGGGRISTIATIIGFCVSGVGAGALCVATGVVEAPRWILGHEARPPLPKPPKKATARAPSRLAASARASEAIATPTPVATPRPARSERRVPTRPTATKDPSQGTTPSSHEIPADLAGTAGHHERVRLRILRRLLAEHAGSFRPSHRRWRVHAMTHRSRRMKRLLVLTTAVLVWGLAPPALADTYDVVACGTGTGNGSWVPHVSNGYVTAYATCPGEGIVTRMSGGSEKAPNLASAFQEFTAPPGTRIVRLTANMLFNSQNGWNLGFIDNSVRWVWCGGSCMSFGDYWYTSIPLNTTWIRAQVTCFNGNGCPRSNQDGILAMKDISVKIDDPTPPSVAITGGSVTRSGWLSGDQDVQVSATDATGVQRVGDARRRTDARTVNGGCDWTRPRPCGNIAETSVLPAEFFGADGQVHSPREGYRCR